MITLLGQHPLVSIVINNYNYERFVGQAIESALQQTYSPVEVIVVDDGSRDRSRELIQGYRARVTPIYKENGGQASALNAGFAACHGEIVIFLDADDLLLPTAAGDMVDVFLSRPETVRVQYRMAVIDAYNQRSGVEKPEKHIPMPSGDIRRQVLTFPFDMPWLPTSGNAFSAEALRQIMPIPADSYGSAGADWYLVHLVCLLGPVFFLDRLEACYRVHGANHYEQAEPSLNLAHIRQTILYSLTTSQFLQQYASLSGLADLPGENLSVSFIANRLTSLRLEPESHPIPGDTRWGLIKLGVTATLRREESSWKLKVLFLGWFLAMALAPKRLATRLAELFFFPQQRKRLNLILGKWHVQPKTV
jgi:glycosyltransferase involved in cell wall biosynthesis